MKITQNSWSSLLHSEISSHLTIPSIRNSISRPPLRRGLPRKQQRPRTQARWIIRGFLLIPLALAWLALLPTAQAQCRNGCDGDNTFLGDSALQHNIGGDGDYNTAIGYEALYSNTTGDYNTANGADALYSNTTASYNTATGYLALYYNNADFNTATGFNALFFNTTGIENTANGSFALADNTTGVHNTANGSAALAANTTGGYNTANGYGALQGNTTGNNNTAIGYLALWNTTGSNNIALGFNAGINRTTGSNNIDIGNAGAAGKSNILRIGTTGTQKNAYIAGISGVTVAGGVGVIIDSSGHLGTVVSSERFKGGIKPMDKASEAILALHPVSFRYKHELDPEGIPQFGLVAEQVEKVNPDLVARDEQGKVYTVRYVAVNALLLNVFLKEHRKVEQQEATITRLKSAVAQQQKDFQATAAHQQKNIEALTAGLQKVSAQVEMSKPASQMVLNNQ
jgi:hypothetical protein